MNQNYSNIPVNKSQDSTVQAFDSYTNTPVEINSSVLAAMKGYFTNEAVVVGVESRTSSPVRIPRDNETLEHPQIKGFYPCGEGAGYAGGIVSAAIDGMRCAEKC